VWLFFVISGYVIAYVLIHKYSRRELLDFYRNRLLRIYPLFLTVSLVAIATSVAQGRDLSLDVGQFLAAQWSHDYSLCGVFWTLGIELQFYLVAPLLMLLVRKSYAGAILYVALLLYPAAAYKLIGESIDNRTTLGNLSHFIAGMAVAFSGYTPSKRAAPWLIVVGVICVGIAAQLYRSVPATFFIAGSLFTDIGGALFLLASVAIGSTRSRVAFWFGALSYGVYAWHGYLLQYFPWFADRLLMLTVVSIALACLTYYVVERPAVSLRALRDRELARDPKPA
jgi:peptidoglycan/LPS O-acetylase OafA/YrhL